MVYIVRNYYSCGCYTTADVPVISRCEHHNGWVVCRTGGNIITPRVHVRSPKIRICNAEILDVMAKLKSPVRLVFSYVEPGLFSHAKQYSTYGFSSARLEYFALLKNVLSDKGCAVLIIDPEDLAAVHYQAMLQGFDIDLRLVPVYFRPDPIRYGRMLAEKTYKVAVGLNTGKLPAFNLKRLDKLLDGLRIPERCRILDTNCNYLDGLVEARPDANIIGVIEDGTRYATACRPAL